MLPHFLPCSTATGDSSHERCLRHSCSLHCRVAFFVSRGIAHRLAISPVQLTFALFLSAHKFGSVVYPSFPTACCKHLHLTGTPCIAKNFYSFKITELWWRHRWIWYERPLLRVSCPPNHSYEFWIHPAPYSVGHEGFMLGDKGAGGGGGWIWSYFGPVELFLHSHTGITVHIFETCEGGTGIPHLRDSACPFWRPHGTVFTVQYSLYSIEGSVLMVQYSQCSTHGRVFTVQYSW